MNAKTESVVQQSIAAPQIASPLGESSHRTKTAASSRQHPTPARQSIFQATMQVDEAAGTVTVLMGFWDIVEPGWGQPLPEIIAALKRLMADPATPVYDMYGPSVRPECTVRQDRNGVDLPFDRQYRATTISTGHIRCLISHIEDCDMRNRVEDTDQPRGTYLPKPYVQRIEQCLHFHTVGISTKGRFHQYTVTNDILAPTLRKGDRIIVDRSQTEVCKGCLYVVGFLNQVGETCRFITYASTLPGGGMCLYVSASGRRVRKYPGDHGEMYPVRRWGIAGPAVYHSPREYLSSAQVKAAGYYIIGKVVGHNSGDIPI